MDPYTHLAAGLLLGSLPPAAGLGWAGTAATVAGSLAPDVDFASRALKSTHFLYFHHGPTHSAAAVLVMGTAIAGVLALAAPAAPFGMLWLLAVAGGALHLALDILMHNTGIMLGYPFTIRRTGHPLVIGVNPPLLSPNCGDGRMTTCLRCQLVSSTRNPIWGLLVGGGLANLGARLAGWPAGATGAAATAFGLAAAYLLWAELNRQRARRRSGFTGRFFVGPAAQGWRRWLAVRRENGRVITRYIDLAYGSVKEDGYDLDILKDPLVQSSLNLVDVRRFFTMAVEPYPRVLRREPPAVVEWADLSYAYPAPFPMFSIRLTLDEDGRAVAADFREHW